VNSIRRKLVLVTIPVFLVAMFAVAGLANTVFHPADYALLSHHVAKERVGSAFSFHTFSGLLGNSVAPATVLLLQVVDYYHESLKQSPEAMKYLESRTETGDLRRSAATNAAPWVRSMVVCALNYSADKPYSVEVDDPARGWISRYAWGTKDYHDALLPRLKQVEAAIKQLASERGMSVETRSYVDTGPILERVYARHAGIGWIGKNTCIIHPKMGSWLFLGVILTSLDLPADTAAPDRCGSCTRCIDACPTNAIVAPGKLDARLCIAYLTIEKRGTVPEELRPAMGHHIFGCDICQDVCPWNRAAPRTSLPPLQSREKLVAPELLWLLSLSEEEFRQKFRGSAVRRAKWRGLVRNACIAAAGDLRIGQRLAHGPHPCSRHMAGLQELLPLVGGPRQHDLLQGRDLAGVVGVIPQPGLRSRLLQLGAPLDQAVAVEEVLGFGHSLGHGRKRCRDVHAVGLARAPSAPSGRGHLSWRRGRTCTSCRFRTSTGRCDRSSRVRT